MAEGVVAEGYYTTAVSDGAISAEASADADLGTAVAVGIAVSGAYTDASFGATSDISAFASGYTGYAIGALLQGQNFVTATNAGSISAEFDGAIGSAYGVIIASQGGSVLFTNDGDITATDADLAVGVLLGSNYYTTLINNGSITADSTAAGSIAVQSGDSLDVIYNYGEINGAIVSGDGDDYLSNEAGGEWNAVGTSYFGLGDDLIVNDGTINMDDAVIDMGYHAVNGNQFINNGTITVSGDLNVIDMGLGLYIPVVPALNPLAFYNYGVIDFQDGDPDDMLTIVGDFGGDGDINVDVSLLSETSDILYIDGSVVAGDTNTINVAVDDLPDSQFTEIPVVYVTGDSVASSFVLGDVTGFSASNFRRWASA